MDSDGDKTCQRNYINDITIGQIERPSLPAVVLGPSDSLESDDLRILIKDEFLKVYKKDSENVKFIFLGPSSSSKLGQNSFLKTTVQWAAELCRSLRIIKSQRAVILPVCHQQQAIQLCTAKLNKKASGEFSASASDVLDVWKYLHNSKSSALAHKEGENKCHNATEETVKCYKDFLRSSGVLDHFDIISLLRENMLRLECVIKNIVVVIEDLENFTMVEKEILKIVLKNVQLYKLFLPLIPLSSQKGCDDLNMSGVDHNVSSTGEVVNTGSLDCCDIDRPCEIAPLQTPSLEADGTEVTKATLYSSSAMEFSALESSLENYFYEKMGPAIYDIQSPREYKRKGSEEYITQLFLSYLRLLINTRDELALATVLSMPGREIGLKDFNNIKSVAQKKNLPIYQTIMSTVMRLQLGGQGYQPDSNCPIVQHAKALTEFVELMHKLQNVIEEENDGRMAYEKIMLILKSKLRSMKGFILPHKSIDVVYKKYISEMHYLHEYSVEVKEQQEENSVSSQTLSVSSSLQPALKLLISLCDAIAGRELKLCISDIIGENILTQNSPSLQGKNQSPFRVPSILSLFSSPNSPIHSGQVSPFSKGLDSSTPLRVRMLKQKEAKEHGDTRFRSCCAWAPNNISPINLGSPSSVNELSPITGPTLMACRKPLVSWDAVFQENAENNQLQNESSCHGSSALNAGESKFERLGTIRKKRSKRSLLVDISNLQQEPNHKKVAGLNEKVSARCSSKSKKEKSLLKGQQRITSFFIK